MSYRDYFVFKSYVGRMGQTKPNKDTPLIQLVVHWTVGVYMM